MRRLFHLMLLIFLINYLSACGVTPTPTYVVPTYSPPVPLTFAPGELPAAQLGQPYQASISVSGNITPVGDAQIIDGALPPGLVLNHEDNNDTVGISGIPQQSGIFSFTVSVSCLGTNVSGQEGQQSYELTVTMETTTEPSADFGPFLFVGHMPEGILTLHAMPNGTLYAINSEMLYRLDGKTWTLVISDPPVPLLDIDPDGRVWAASSDVAAMWREGSWTQYGLESGWTAETEASCWDENWIPHPMLFASDGTVWIAGCRDVRHLDGQNWQVYSLSDMGMTDEQLSENYIDGRIFSLAETKGKIWIAECTYGGPGVAGGTGVRRFDGKTWYGTGTPVSEGCARVERGPDESLWAVVTAVDARGKHPTFYAYDAATDIWTGQQFPDPVDAAGDENQNRMGSVTDWTFDPNGDPWIELERCGGASCGNGTVHYHYLRDSRSFVQVGADLFYPVGPVVNTSRLLFDSKGIGWLFTTGPYSTEADGIYQLEGDRFELMAAAFITSAVRTPDFRIWISVARDGQNELWVLEP